MSIVLFCTFFFFSYQYFSKEDAYKKPNIVFILSDDHAAAAISSYGSSLVKTPNIDRIAQQGVRFTNAFVTSSLCSPSRAAILTGKYAEKSGYRRIRDVFDGAQQTFPKLLQTGGYETAVFGKWHLGSEPTGFDFYEVVKGQGGYFNPRFYKNGMEWNKRWRIAKEGNEQNDKGYFSDIITDKSIDWLEERTSDNPFALFVHHKAPHSPHITPEKYDSLFTGNIPQPDNFDDPFERKNSFLITNEAPHSKLKNAAPGAVISSRDDWNRFTQKEYTPPIKPGTPAYKDWAYQTLYKGYYRQIVNLDENIGRLLDYLEDTGLDENTIIVYASDNGWFLGDHGLFNKMWMYEESLKIPLIMRFSDHFSGNRVEESIVSILDFAPTFLEYAGVEIPSDMQGRSMKGLLEDAKPDDWPTSFFYHYYDQWDVPEHYGLRTHDYKLIKFIDPTRTEYELYDLKADPKELHNVFDNPQYKSIQDSLMKELEQQKIKFES